MTKEEFINISIDKELKFMSVMDDVEGMSSFHKTWTCNGVSMLFGDLCLHTVESNDAYPVKSCRVISRPLSDLTNPITHKGETFVPNMILYELFGYIPNVQHVDYVTYEVLQKLIEWHFDIAGLIEKGEAIDVNTLDKNPYV